MTYIMECIHVLQTPVLGFSIGLLLNSAYWLLFSLLQQWRRAYV